MNIRIINVTNTVGLVVFSYMGKYIFDSFYLFNNYKYFLLIFIPTHKALSFLSKNSVLSRQPEA